jgi:hypothetical protein
MMLHELRLLTWPRRCCTPTPAPLDSSVDGCATDAAFADWCLPAGLAVVAAFDAGLATGLAAELAAGLAACLAAGATAGAAVDVADLAALAAARAACLGTHDSPFQSRPL